jgi:zinc protease
VQQPVNTVTLRLSWQGPSVDTDAAATYAADLLGNLVANPASRFRKRLVDSRLAFSAGLSYYTQHNVGPSNASLQTTPQNLHAARDTLLAELRAMADETYFSEEELADAKRQAVISAIQERERASEWAHSVGFWWSVAGLEYYRNYVPNLQRVTRADLARYVRTYLLDRPYVIAAMLNPQARTQLNLTPQTLTGGGR